MLAGCRALAHQIEMRVRRGQDFDAVDALVGEDGVETAPERKGEFLAERFSPRLARTECGHDFDAVLQVDEALGMRRHRHAEADDGDTMFGHCDPYRRARIAPRS